jgi:hypothetical protein
MSVGTGKDQVLTFHAFSPSPQVVGGKVADLLPGLYGDPNHTTHMFAQIANVWLDNGTSTLNPSAGYQDQVYSHAIRGEGIKSPCIDLADATLTLQLRNDPTDIFKSGNGTLRFWFGTHFGGKQNFYVLTQSDIRIPLPNEGWQEIKIPLPRGQSAWKCLAPAYHGAPGAANIGNEGLVICDTDATSTKSSEFAGYASWTEPDKQHPYPYYQCSGNQHVRPAQDYGCSDANVSTLVSNVDLDMGIAVWRPIPESNADKFKAPHYPTGTLQLRHISIQHVK